MQVPSIDNLTSIAALMTLGQDARARLWIFAEGMGPRKNYGRMHQAQEFQHGITTNFEA